MKRKTKNIIETNAKLKMNMNMRMKRKMNGNVKENLNEYGFGCGLHDEYEKECRLLTRR
jgi:hypothetical protein